MFALDNFDLESTMARHFFENSHITNGSTSSSEFFFGDDNSTDSDTFSGFNSDQENTEEKR